MSVLSPMPEDLPVIKIVSVSSTMASSTGVMTNERDSLNRPAGMVMLPRFETA